MLPTSSQSFNSEINIITMPSKTFKLNINNSRISNNISDANSLVQSIYKILNTSRYKYAIYDWNYGIELDDLFGMPIAYVKAELERRISDALSIDDRISDVYDFQFSNLDTKGELFVQFTVNSVFGEVDIDWEVSV